MRRESDHCENCWLIFRLPPDVRTVLGAGKKDRGISKGDKRRLQPSATLLGFQFFSRTPICMSPPFIFTDVLLGPSGPVQFFSHCKLEDM